MRYINMKNGLFAATFMLMPSIGTSCFERSEISLVKHLHILIIHICINFTGPRLMLSHRMRAMLSGRIKFVAAHCGTDTHDGPRTNDAVVDINRVIHVAGLLCAACVTIKTISFRWVAHFTPSVYSSTCECNHSYNMRHRMSRSQQARLSARRDHRCQWIVVNVCRRGIDTRVCSVLTHLHCLPSIHSIKLHLIPFHIHWKIILKYHMKKNSGVVKSNLNGK